MKTVRLFAIVWLTMAAFISGLALDVTTNITVDTVWTTNDSPVTITWGDFRVLTNATLTIDPGVTVGISGNFTVNGCLRAIGTAQAPIVFQGTNATAVWYMLKLRKVGISPSTTNLLAYTILTNMLNYIDIFYQTVSFSNCEIHMEGNLSSYGLTAYAIKSSGFYGGDRVEMVSNTVYMTTTNTSSSGAFAFVGMDGMPSLFQGNSFVFTAPTGNFSSVSGIKLYCSNTDPFDSLVVGNAVQLDVQALGAYPPTTYGINFASGSGQVDGIVSNNTVNVQGPADLYGVYLINTNLLIANTFTLAAGGFTNFATLYGIKSLAILSGEVDTLVNNRVWITNQVANRIIYGLQFESGRVRGNRIGITNGVPEAWIRGIDQRDYEGLVEGNTIVIESTNGAMVRGITFYTGNTNSNVSVRNNIFSGHGGTNGYGILYDPETCPTLIADHNLFWNFESNYVGLAAGTGDLATNPLFADRSFHLTPQSPAIDAGTNLGWTLTAEDMDGNPRVVRERVDIGAHEMAMVATPAISPAGGIFLGAVTVTLACATSGATNRYTLDGSDPTNGSPLYASPFSLATNAIVKARAFRDDLLDSAVTAAVFTVYATNQVLLTIHSAYDTPVPATGLHVYLLGQGLTCLVSTATMTQGATQFVCSGWALSGLVDTNGSASGSSTSVVVALTNNTDLAWRWITNFTFNVTANAGGGVSGSTSGWYALGDSLVVTAAPGAHYVFAGWSGDTQGDTNDSVMTVTMNQPRQLTAHFTDEILTLIIQSSHGSPAPATGAHAYGYGRILTNGAGSSPLTQGSTQYVCAGWSLDGNEPSLGTEAGFVMTLTNNATLTWRWQTNHLLMASAGTGGAVAGATNGWYAAGAGATLIAMAAANYQFKAWSGDTQGDTNNNVMPLTLDRPRSLTAYFTPEIFPPPAPTGVTASDGDYTGRVAIVWTGNAQATAYEVWRSPSATLIGSASDPRYDDTSAMPGIVYTYWITATNSSGFSEFSEPDTGWRRCVPVALAADFDGDHLADPAVYQGASGTWNIRYSSSDYATSSLSAFLGGADKSPLAADFDGDRLADFAICAPTSASWQIRSSAGGYAVLDLPGFLGTTGSTALATDFDGDRLADPAICDPASGTWIVKLSGSAYARIDLADFLGGPSFSALAGDFDGDGLGDPAIYDPLTGNWSLKLSSDNYERRDMSLLLGSTRYLALAGDFDGDGKDDPSGFNPSTGDWIILLSGSGYFRLELPAFLNDR